VDAGWSQDAFVRGNANAEPAVIKQGVQLFLQAKKFPDHGHILSLKMGALVQQVCTLQRNEFQYPPDDASGQGDKTDECCVAGHGVRPLSHGQVSKLMGLCDTFVSVQI
jgi:hypothetical protein